MNGTRSTVPSPSSVARISRAGRTSTRSPARRGRVWAALTSTSLSVRGRQSASAIGVPIATTVLVDAIASARRQRSAEPGDSTMTATTTESALEAHGISPRGRVIHNPTTAQLYTHALANGDGRLAHGGALVVDTGRFTGRSPQDKFVVDEDESRDRIWWGAVNHPLSEQHFDGVRAKVTEHLAGRDPLYVVDHFAGANPDHRVGVRVVTASPYHALFAKTMFIVPTARELVRFSVDALVLHAPDVEAVPEEDGTRTGTFVALHPTRGEVVIGGTFYAGEIKKGIFTLMNDRLPRAGVLPMHCSANVGAEDGRVAVFFGLSGTGKTTLSADPDRSLIGDDEHGWSDSGVFNIEGGCYAKVIRLS